MSDESAEVACCDLAHLDWGGLGHDEIIRLNTYDFMAYVGKRVINPGGVRGRDHILARLTPERVRDGLPIA